MTAGNLVISEFKRGEALAFTRGIALVRGERSCVVFRSPSPTGLALTPEAMFCSRHNAFMPTRVRNAATLHGVLGWSCTSLVRLPFVLPECDCCFFSLTFACFPSDFLKAVSNRICEVSQRIHMKPRARRHRKRISCGHNRVAGFRFGVQTQSLPARDVASKSRSERIERARSAREILVSI